MRWNKDGSINHTMSDRVKDYNSETVLKTYLGDANEWDLERLIGKKIKRIENEEYKLKIIFEDDSWIEANGHTYDGCSLYVNIETPQVDI